MPSRKVIKPTLSYDAIRKQVDDTYLRRELHCDRLVKKDEHCVDGEGRTKYLLLRNVLSKKCVTGTYAALRDSVRFKRSNRPPLRSSAGGDATMGWWKDARNADGPYLLKAARESRLTYDIVLMPLLNRMSELIRQHLPEEWKEQMKRARDNGGAVVGDDGHNAFWLDFEQTVTKTLSGEPRAGELLRRFREDVPKMLLQPAIFSTITLNHNTTCRSHVDSSNGRGLSCMTTFGDFSGGELCFPRLRVAFALRPGDVLIADTNNEQHGNFLPLKPDRISVVAYLREL